MNKDQGSPNTINSKTGYTTRTRTPIVRQSISSSSSSSSSSSFSRRSRAAKRGITSNARPRTPRVRSNSNSSLSTCRAKKKANVSNDIDSNNVRAPIITPQPSRFPQEASTSTTRRVNIRSVSMNSQQHKTFVEHLPEDEYFSSLSDYIRNNRMKEDELHLDNPCPNNKPGDGKWTQPDPKPIKVFERYATQMLTESMQNECLVIKEHLKDVLNVVDPSLEDIWDLYFGTESPVVKALQHSLKIDYATILRLLSTTAVLQGNKWSISDYASEFSIADYNQLKVCFLIHYLQDLLGMQEKQHL